MITITEAEAKVAILAINDALDDGKASRETLALGIRLFEQLGEEQREKWSWAAEDFAAGLAKIS